MTEKKPFRDRVAEEFIRRIEDGTAPWMKPWTPGLHPPPMNPTTDKPYKGINSLWLEMQGYADPRWMTFKQAKEIGAQVRKGERASQIEYWQWSERRVKQDDNGKPVLDDLGKKQYIQIRLQRPKVFHANVFNAEQMTGLEPYKAPEPTFDTLEKAEAILKGTGVSIIHDQNDRAFYSLASDEIHLPVKAAFANAYDYYATALHETAHATGHPDRLNREFGPFGSTLYAKEELRAEIASSMIAKTLGTGHDPDRHAAYVESWLKALKEDRNEIFRAARDAETIHTWVLEPEKRLELERETGKRSAPAQENVQTITEHTEKERLYLTVPFTEKEEAKAIGARWDRKEKSWYVDPDTDKALIDRWQVAPEKETPLPPLSDVKRQQMAAAREIPAQPEKPAHARKRTKPTRALSL